MSQFKLENNQGFYYLTSPLLNNYKIKHLFSTIKDTKRNLKNGVNFGFREGFSKEDTLSNYGIVAELFEVPISNITKSTQVHEDKIFFIKEEHLGMGVTKNTSITNADGILTGLPKVPLCIFSADCVPILIADKNNTVCCAVHSGWRGTAKKIAQNAIRFMIEKFDIPVSEIICAIGPCISQCCFEVSVDVINELQKEIDGISQYAIKKENGKFNLDLKGINQKILMDMGIMESHIDVCDNCTMCEDEFFYSYRRDGELTGRLAAFIMVGGSF